jgi:CBS domain-containing protein
MFAAKDLMTRDVITVTPETEIGEAIETMLTERVSGLPVVDDETNLVGILSETDVVGLIYDRGSLETKQVRHFMTERTTSFDADDSLVDICDFLSKNVFRRVPIISEGKVVGLISIPDILRYTMTLKEEHPPKDSKAKREMTTL